MEKIKTSAHYYNPAEWAKMDTEDKKKSAKAFIYDFLKKKFALPFIYKLQSTCNPILSQKQDVTYKECLDITVDELISKNVILRDYFFDTSIMCDWDRLCLQDNQRIKNLDKAWMKFLGYY